MKAMVNGALGPLEVQSLDRQRSMTVQPMDRSGEWNGLPGRALGRAGISFKSAAADAECDPSLWSARLAAKKHLPWSQLGKLGAEFAAELVVLVIEFYNLPVAELTEQDRIDLHVGRTIREAMQRSLAR